MKKIAAAVAVIAYCIAAGGEISLAEKIALAKKMADAAAAGKEESGLVVNGGFDFSKMLEKYGSEIAQSDKTARLLNRKLPPSRTCRNFHPRPQLLLT